MFKKMLLSLLMSLAVLSPTVDAQAKPNLVVLSIGVNYNAVKEKREDVFAKEAMHLESGLEKACDSVYTVRKKYIHSEKATRQACLDGLDWVGETAKDGDLAVVYIGAHGGGSDKGKYEFYPAQDTVSSKEIITKLKDLKCHLFLLVDTCHAGAMLVDWKEPGKKVSILAACKADQSAYVWKFVTPFVEALAVADYNDDKTIDLSEVEEYVIKNTSPKQTPVSSKSKSKIVICQTEKRYLLPFYEKKARLFNGVEMLLSEALREMIKATGKPVYQIARESGVAQPILSRFMSGKRSITLDTAEKLSTYLGLELRAAKPPLSLAIPRFDTAS